MKKLMICGSKLLIDFNSYIIREFFIKIKIWYEDKIELFKLIVNVLYFVFIGKNWVFNKLVFIWISVFLDVVILIYIWIVYSDVFDLEEFVFF